MGATSCRGMRMGFAIIKRRESLTTGEVSDYYSALASRDSTSLLSRTSNSFVGGRQA